MPFSVSVTIELKSVLYVNMEITLPIMLIMGTLNQNIRMVKIKEHNYRRMVEL